MISHLGNLKSRTRSANRHPSRRKFLGVGVVGFLLAVIALGSFSNFRSQISNSEIATESKRIVVGSKDFTESVILAEILAQMLEKKGIAVTRQFELGGNPRSRQLIVKADRRLSRIHGHCLHDDPKTSADH